MFQEIKDKSIVDMAHETIQMDSELKRAYSRIEYLEETEKQLNEMVSFCLVDAEQTRFNILLATLKTIERS